MKKFIVALAVGAMLMGFASMAAAEVTVGGSAEVRYDLWKNINLNGGANSFSTTNFFDERIMVNVDAKVAEGLEGFVEFDTDNFNWGQQTSIGNVPTYLNNLKAQGSIGLRQAWINAMVPGVPVGVKVGHQPLALGHGIWLDTHRYGSDAILAYSKPIPALLIAGAYVQMSQSLPAVPLNSGAFARTPLSQVPVLSGGSAVVTPTLSQARNSSFQMGDTKAYAALANFTWMENNTVGFNVTYVSDADSAATLLGGDHKIWATNAAIVLDGTVAGLTYKGEFDWLHADTENVFGTDQSYIVNGYAGMLGVNMNVMNLANVGMEVAYGSGNSAGRPQIFYNPGQANNNIVNALTPGGAETKHQDHAYYTPYNQTSYNYAFLYNDKIGQGPLGSGGGFGFGDGFGGFGLANTGYIKVSVGMNPTDRLKIGIDGLYLRASESMLPGQSKDLGWEIDGNVGYKIYDNLSLDLTGGVFVPGAWYAFQGHAPAVNADILTDPTDASSPVRRNVAWGMETKLSMKF